MDSVDILQMGNPNVSSLNVPKNEPLSSFYACFSLNNILFQFKNMSSTFIYIQDI